jgi:hypothetical protein
MVPPNIIWTPQYYRKDQRSCDGGEGGGTEFDRFYLFLGSSKAAMGGGGAQHPVGRGNESKKTRARSARARTRGQNPLVNNKFGRYWVTVSFIPWKRFS